MQVPHGVLETIAARQSRCNNRGIAGRGSTIASHDRRNESEVETATKSRSISVDSATPTNGSNGRTPSAARQANRDSHSDNAVSRTARSPSNARRTTSGKSSTATSGGILASPSNAALRTFGCGSASPAASILRAPIACSGDVQPTAIIARIRCRSNLCRAAGAKSRSGTIQDAAIRAAAVRTSEIGSFKVREIRSE